MNQEKIPTGCSMALVQNEDVTTGYMGFTKEQKREMLTHALIARSGENTVPIAAKQILPKNEDIPQDRLLNQ